MSPHIRVQVEHVLQQGRAVCVPQCLLGLPTHTLVNHNLPAVFVPAMASQKDCKRCGQPNHPAAPECARCFWPAS